MKLPLISVIVPVYNVKNYLPDCLDSLKQQTYRNLEILLIDDGSTDGSATLLEAYASLDSRARVFHTKNSGLSAARNFGLKKAKGNYVTFLDSDDYLAPDAIEYLYKLISKSGAKLSVCSHYERKENGELRDFNSVKLKTGKLSVETALYQMLNERGFMLSAWGKLYTRELFAKTAKLPAIQFPENKLHEDVGTTYLLFLRAAAVQSNAQIAYGSQPKYYYNLRQSSITNSGFNLKRLDLVIQTDAMCSAAEKAYPSLNNTANLRRVHARFSVLRQIVGKAVKTDRERRIEDSLVSYLKQHKAWVFKNPEAGRRDKFAMLSLLLGRKCFSFAWACYLRFFK